MNQEKETVVQLHEEKETEVQMNQMMEAEVQVNEEETEVQRMRRRTLKFE